MGELRLLGERDADGVLVVLDEEDDRDLIDGSEIHRDVGVPLARGAVAEEHEHGGPFTFELRSETQPDRVQRLRRQRRALRRRPPPLRVVATVRVAPEQRECLDGRNAPSDEGDGVAVGREHPVLAAQCQHGSDLARFLAAGRRVDGEAALPSQAWSQAGRSAEPSRGGGTARPARLPSGISSPAACEDGPVGRDQAGGLTEWHDLEQAGEVRRERGHLISGLSGSVVELGLQCHLPM